VTGSNTYGLEVADVGIGSGQSGDHRAGRCPDVGKATLVCCVRVPGTSGGKRVQEVTTYSTMTRSLQVMAGRSAARARCHPVVMEATSDYWKPPFYPLKAHGFEV